MKRRDFLKYSAAAVPVTPAVSVAALTERYLQRRDWI